jgi:hypothetical protein
MAIAPTYMITKESARNSTSKQTSNPDDNKKTHTRDNTEWTGFRELITEKQKKETETRKKIK